METITEKNYKKDYMLINIIKNKVDLVQEEKTIQKNLLTIVGIDLIGNRQIIGLSFEKEDDNHYYLDLLEEIKSKGVERIYFIESEDNIKLRRAIKISYPGTNWIESFTMNLIKIWQYYSSRSRSNLISKLKQLYTYETYDEAINYLNIFKEEYKDNKLMTVLLDKYFNNLESNYKYNKEIRLFLFNHNSFTDIYDKIKSVKGCKTIKDIIDARKDYLIKLENNRLYNKINWMNIINNSSLYFDDLFVKVEDNL